MLTEKMKKSYFNFKNINFVLHNPSILKTIIQGKSKDEIRAVARRLIEINADRPALQETQKFISSLKNTSPYYINQNYQPKP